MGLFNVYTVSNAYRSDYFQYLSEQWANDTDEFTGAWNRSSDSYITRVKTDTDMPKASMVIPANQTGRLRTHLLSSRVIQDMLEQEIKNELAARHIRYMGSGGGAPLPKVTKGYMHHFCVPYLRD